MTQQALLDIPVIFKFPQSYDGITIRFNNSFAWGNNITGDLVCLGRESDVRMAIVNPKLKSHIPDVDQLIELERQQLAEESENDGISKFRNSRMEGSGRFRASRINKAAARRVKTRKRLSLRKS